MEGEEPVKVEEQVEEPVKVEEPAPVADEAAAEGNNNKRGREEADDEANDGDQMRKRASFVTDETEAAVSFAIRIKIVSGCPPSP